MSNKTIIITGGVSGFGARLTEVLLEKGWNVVMVDRDAQRGETLAAELQKRFPKSASAKPNDPPRVSFQQCDVSKMDNIKRVFEFTESTYGGFDAVANNAGLGDADGYYVLSRLHDGTKWDTTIRVNIDAVIYGTREFSSRRMSTRSLTFSRSLLLRNIVFYLSLCYAVSYFKCSPKSPSQQRTRHQTLSRKEQEGDGYEYCLGRRLDPLFQPTHLQCYKSLCSTLYAVPQTLCGTWNPRQCRRTWTVPYSNVFERCQSSEDRGVFRRDDEEDSAD